MSPKGMFSYVINSSAASACRSLWLALGLVAGLALSAAERPNILWIVSEDNSAYTIGAYGDPQARTPHLDALAAEGNRYTRAYSGYAVCAPARSTLMTGVHAVTQGTHLMRSRYELPAPITPFPTLLRAAGYFCTSSPKKTDFNFAGDDHLYWDDWGLQADYQKRAPGQPFFAMINVGVSHEQFLFPHRVEQLRNEGAIPPKPRNDPATVAMPPYLPDDPQVRADFATYYDVVGLMDRQVGGILAKLESQGLAEDTIVFYFSDHGGILPRGKRYLYDSGTRVPCIVRVPEKWREWAPAISGEPVDRLISFVDFAPTVLALAGLQPPFFMQGAPFLGPLQATTEPVFAYLAADRFDEGYTMSRAITDGRFRYLRNFQLEQARAIEIAWPFQMTAWQAWRTLALSGTLEGPPADLWDPHPPRDELYDLAADPWEVNNLVDDPAHAERRATMRAELQAQMREHRDLGLIPEAMYVELGAGASIYRYARSEAFDFEAVLAAAWRTGHRDEASRVAVLAGLADASPVVRYWSLRALLTDLEVLRTHRQRVEGLLDDPMMANRLMAARCLLEGGPHPRAESVFEAAASASQPEAVRLYAAHLLRQIERRR